MDMTGLLDFAKTPEGQGLLAAVAGGLTGARRGTPINNIGRAGLSGLAGYSNAVDTQGTQELRTYQLQKIKNEQEDAARKRAAQTNFSATVKPEDRPLFDIAPDKYIENMPQFQRQQLVEVADPRDPLRTVKQWMKPGETQGTVAGYGAMPEILDPRVQEAKRKIAIAGRAPAADRSERAPVGYRFDAAGNLAAIPGGPASAKGMEKPLPASALKMQQGELDAIGTASAIQSDIGALEKQIVDEKLKFGGVRNLINTGKNMAGISDEESRNFSTFKSSLERLRNDSLRLNNGVQTDGDAQRAWNELFESINDTELVKQRLAEIKKINERAVNIRKMNVDSIRGNFGAEPLDTSRYQNQPAAVGAGRESDPKDGASTVKTADDYNKLPSGATYIDPNGNTRRKP